MSRNCRRRYTRKRRQKPAIASMPCTTRSAGKMFWPMPMLCAAEQGRTGNGRSGFCDIEAYGLVGVARFPNLRSLSTCCVRLELRPPFPPPALPGFPGTTSLSATPGRPACPSRASGWSDHVPGAFRVACAFLVYMLPPLPRCRWAETSLKLTHPYQPSP